MWRAALLVRLLPRRARSGSRDDGVPWRCLPCAPCVDARRARNAQCVAMQRQPVGAPKKKKRIRSTSWRNTAKKDRRPATPHAATDMERPGDKNEGRPAAEINVRRGRARRLGDGAPTFTPRLTYWRLVLVYRGMLPYTTSLTRGRGAAGVSQLQRRHRRGRGEVPQRLAGRRPLRLGEAVARRDHDE